MADVRERIEANPRTAFEPSDWPFATVGLILAIVFILVAIAPLVLLWVYPTAVSDVDRRLTVALPAPQLEVDTAASLRRFDAAERRKLDTYYWINRRTGIVHIPIEDAMRKLAQTGIPGFPPRSNR